MDALRQQLALNRALFAQSGWPIVFAILTTVAAVWTAFSGDAGLRTSCELMSAVSISFCIGPSVQRIPALAICAGQLGIPNHRSRLRSAQFMLLTASLVFSILLETRFGMDLRTLVIPLGITAVITSIATLPLFAGGVAVAVFIVNSAYREFLPKLFEPVGATVFIAICLAVIGHWFRAVHDLERRAAIASRSLADAGHEAGHADDLDRAQALLASNLGSALEVDPTGRLSPRKFWIGMGYDLTGSWKVTGYSLLVAILSFTAIHFYYSGRADTLVYAILSGFILIAEFGRFNGMHEAWMQTPQEQSVLILTPRWPQARQFKIEFLRSQTSGYPRHSVFWIVLSVFVVALGVVDGRTVLMVGVSLLILVMSICALMMHYVSRQRARQTSPYAIGYALLTLIGLGILMTGWAWSSPSATLVGLGTIIVPAILPVYQFCTRRLQFPVQPLLSPPG